MLTCAYTHVIITQIKLSNILTNSFSPSPIWPNVVEGYLEPKRGENFKIEEVVK